MTREIIQKKGGCGVYFLLYPAPPLPPGLPSLTVWPLFPQPVLLWWMADLISVVAFVFVEKEAFFELTERESVFNISLKRCDWARCVLGGVRKKKKLLSHSMQVSIAK